MPSRRHTSLSSILLWPSPRKRRGPFFVVKSDALSGSEQPPREPLARYAGLTGAPPPTSRIPGQARDQTPPPVFGAVNAIDPFVVRRAIPNLLRDLFAEG